ncbi:MAG: hypothetical protein ACFFAS_07690 [Promethearchaeota archaeon]
MVDYENSLASIYTVEISAKKMKEMGFSLDSKRDVLRLGDKSVRIASNSGFNGKKGYCIGKLLWGVNCLLNGKKYPRINAVFPSSTVYMLEVIAKSRNAIDDINIYLN